MGLQQSDGAEKRSSPARIGGAVRITARIAELFLGAPEHASRLAEPLGVGDLVDRHTGDACKERAAY